VPVISIQSFYIDIGYRLFKEFTSRAESFRFGSTDQEMIWIF
jgi:hypothetical protein